MVRVLIGELFESDAQTLVNTVNCVGIMGKGIALEFKKRFPSMYKDYVLRCKRGEVRIGEPYIFRQLTPPSVINFPTKQHWRSASRLDDIVRGLEYLVGHYKEWGITSLALPALGCGHGQLEWSVVGPTLYQHLLRLDVPVELFAPYGTPHDELKFEFLGGSGALPPMAEPPPEPTWIRAGWIVVLEVLGRVTAEPHHWPISRSTLNTMAYIATREGVPTGLRFERGKYGLYCPKLHEVETRLVNNGLLSVGQRGKRANLAPGYTFDAAQKAYRGEIERWSPLIDRMANLFMRLDSRYAGMVGRVMFTVDHMLATAGIRPSEQDVIKAALDWKLEHRLDSELDLANTVRSLTALGWIDLTRSLDLRMSDEFGDQAQSSERELSVELLA